MKKTYIEPKSIVVMVEGNELLAESFTMGLESGTTNATGGNLSKQHYCDDYDWEDEDF